MLRYWVCLLGWGMDVFMCSVHMCMQVCKDMSILMWRLEFDTGYLPESIITFETGSLGEPGASSPIWIGWPASELQAAVFISAVPAEYKSTVYYPIPLPKLKTTNKFEFFSYIRLFWKRWEITPYWLVNFLKFWHNRL